MSIDIEGLLRQLIGGDDTAPAAILDLAQTSDSPRLLVAAALVAAEPLIAKAMNIDWDEKGRLWVSETPEYPNGRRVPKVSTVTTCPGGRSDA